MRNISLMEESSCFGGIVVRPPPPQGRRPCASSAGVSLCYPPASTDFLEIVTLPNAHRSLLSRSHLLWPSGPEAQVSEKAGDEMDAAVRGMDLHARTSSRCATQRNTTLSVPWCHLF